jgi:general secretion pathway protein L
MAQRIVGIDLGSFSVKVVVVSPKSRGASPRGAPARAAFDVVGYGEAVVAAADAGEDAAATLRDRQADALLELKRRGLLEGDLFVAGVPGENAAIRMLNFPFNDREKIAEALPYALESEISLDVDDIVFPYAFVDRPGEDGRKRRDAEVMCAYARKDAVQDVIDTLGIAGVDPRHIELDALALERLWDGVFSNHEVEPQGPSALKTAGGTIIEVGDGAPAPAVAIVDIGHRRTSVCILREGKVVSAHTLLHGGADATRALAKDIGLSLPDAERGKRKEAFIEVLGAEAQFPEQRQISDVLKKAHAPLVRRIRQVFQATMSTSRLRVVKVILVGGGSKVMNLDRHLAEELNIKVSRGRELQSFIKAAPQLANTAVEGDLVEAGMAFANALAGLSARSTSRIDFRVGPFAWKGDYDFLREGVPALGAWAASLLFVVALGSIAQVVMLSREADALMQKQLALCEQITGQKIDSTSRCVALIQERINGTAGFQVPEVSAVDVFMEISRRLPYTTEIKRKVTEMDITSERVRLKGTTTTYEAIDTMVERLQGGRCFQLVEKGKARNINAESVEMNITINLDCAAAAGDGKVIAPPPAPTAASLASSSSSSPTPTASAPTEEEPAPAPPPAPPRSARSELEEPDSDKAVLPGRAKSSPEQIEARRERLRQLREERAERRRQMLDSQLANPNIRDRFEKTVPALRADDEGEEE